MWLFYYEVRSTHAWGGAYQFEYRDFPFGLLLADGFGQRGLGGLVQLVILAVTHVWPWQRLGGP